MATSERCNWYEYPPRNRNRRDCKAANMINWWRNASGWEPKGTPCCFGSWENWWRPKVFSRLSQLVPGRLLELLETWVDLLRKLDEKIGRAKAALAKRCSGPRPKGAGAPSLVQLQSEVLDWGLYSNRRKIGCLAGMVPSE